MTMSILRDGWHALVSRASMWDGVWSSARLARWSCSPTNRLEMEELFGGSAEKVSGRILSVLRTESTAAIVSSPT
jgi:hypothetical protein